MLPFCPRRRRQNQTLHFWKSKKPLPWLWYADYFSNILCFWKTHNEFWTVFSTLFVYYCTWHCFFQSCWPSKAQRRMTLSLNIAQRCGKEMSTCGWECIMTQTVSTAWVEDCENKTSTIIILSGSQKGKNALSAVVRRKGTKKTMLRSKLL